MESSDRYLPPHKVNPFLNQLKKPFELLRLGTSVNDLPIYGLRIGRGSKKILMWSQMHGNESTTTRAILEIIDDFRAGNGGNLLESLTLFIIPQLNPDGALAYTRLNANEVDLNRDAIELTQPESRVLRAVFEDFKPHYCFNLHGQRTIFAAGKNGKPATLSFLSPAADPERTVTAARLKAMQLIVAINSRLQSNLPDQIGRYDDTFNINCVGDFFTSKYVPTVLFEAGHYPEDYDRNTTLKFIQKSILIALESIVKEDFLDFTLEEYQKIPQNSKDYIDIIVDGVTIKGS